jgi:hypothetical protein
LDIDKPVLLNTKVLLETASTLAPQLEELGKLSNVELA